MHESERGELRRTFEEWRANYEARMSQFQSDKNDDRTRSRLADLAKRGWTGSEVLADELSESGYVYVVTRFNGRIISALAATHRGYESDSSDGSDSDSSASFASSPESQRGSGAQMVIEYAVSAPQSTLPRNADEPYRYAQDAVRGAGEAGVRALARYARGFGIAALAAQAVSVPSAIVKQRVGFTRLLPKDEL